MSAQRWVRLARMGEGSRAGWPLDAARNAVRGAWYRALVPPGVIAGGGMTGKGVPRDDP